MLLTSTAAIRDGSESRKALLQLCEVSTGEVHTTELTRMSPEVNAILNPVTSSINNY